jgi:hypothetical protein
MYSEGVVELVKEVLTSWQVIVVSIVLILYLSLVFYTAKSYHRPRVARPKKPKKTKEPAAAAPAAEAHEEAEAATSNDELGLEEA